MLLFYLRQKVSKQSGHSDPIVPFSLQPDIGHLKFGSEYSGFSVNLDRELQGCRLDLKWVELLGLRESDKRNLPEVN